MDAPTPPANPPAAAAAAPATINIGDFQKIDFRVGKVLECALHPNADKLLVLQVDMGDGQKRQVCAGVRAYYAPEQLVGKNVIVVANLEPRQIRGQESQGMILAAHDTAAGKVIMLTVMEPAAAGSKVS